MGPLLEGQSVYQVQQEVQPLKYRSECRIQCLFHQIWPHDKSDNHKFDWKEASCLFVCSLAIYPDDLLVVIAIAIPK